MELQPHQKQTVIHLEKRCVNQHGLLVFHNMGTGKTNTSIGWLINRKMLYRKDHTKPSSRKQPRVSKELKKSRKSRKRKRTKESKKVISVENTAYVHKDRSLKTHRSRSHQRAGSLRGSASSSSYSSSDPLSEVHTTRKKLPPAKREFDYLIVCPETIKSSWDKEAQKMGFDLDNTKVINYKFFHGQVQSQTFDVFGKNVIFDEAHHLAHIMKLENMEYYEYILKSLNQADKLLLLTGTPEHGGRADFMILVNLVTKRNKFPVHLKELYEKYRNTEEFEKRKKSIFFNWIQPVAWEAFRFIYITVAGIITREMGKYVRNHLYKGYAKKYVIKAIKEPKEDEHFFDEEIDAHPRKILRGGGFMNIFGIGKNVLKAVQDQTKQSISDTIKIIPKNPTEATNLVKGMIYNEIDNARNIGENTLLFIADEIDRGIQSAPGMMIMYAMQKYVMSAFQFLQVEKNPQRALQKAPLNLQKMSTDIGRYVSYYQQKSDSLDFGQTKIENPTEALYTSYQSQQCLFFIYGTMNERMVRFYANVDHNGAKLKINEFRTLDGVEKYGRCISNMWDIVDHIINKQIKFQFDDTNGSVILKYKSISEKKQNKKHYAPKEVVQKAIQTMKGCPKFDNIVSMLQTAEKNKQRTLIRSDFKKQGIYLLSAFLNSKNIPHFYIHKSMSKEDRNRILEVYNDVYQPVIANDKQAKLLEYVDAKHPLDSHLQLQVGVTVRSTDTGLEWKQARIVNINAQNESVDVEDEQSQIHQNVLMSTIQRFFEISYTKNNKRALVNASALRLLPYDGPTQSPIMLLDSDSSEGISLMGIENVHLLEPLEHVAERDQSLARAIRFQSHRHLPLSRHIVHVYTHIGVVKPTDYGMDTMKAAMKKELFEFERNKHINEQFAGVVPRAAKGNMRSDPIGYLFDQWWNGIPLLHDGFDGTNSTPDTMVLENVSAEETHMGAYTQFIEKTNVINSAFVLPEDCQESDQDIQTKNFIPIPK